MLTIYRDTPASIRNSAPLVLPDQVIWIDLLNPTADERAFVEGKAGVRVPSAEALSEIESSSRLIVDRDVVYLSAWVVSGSDSSDPILFPAGFILSEKLLVTIRFTELSAFAAVAKRVHDDKTIYSSAGAFIALMEALVDRGADVLERLGGELDNLSRSVFRGDPAKRMHAVRSNKALRHTLSAIGTIGDRMSQAGDVLLGLDRITSFVESLQLKWIAPELEKRLGSITKDISSLNDYQTQLSSKVQFLLDAILGFINIEQNDLFKVLTIVSVVGIPPTLMAGIYGMNFKYMPELNWGWGYPFGLAVIILSALIPVIWFKWRHWI